MSRSAPRPQPGREGWDWLMSPVYCQLWVCSLPRLLAAGRAGTVTPRMPLPCQRSLCSKTRSWRSEAQVKPPTLCPWLAGGMAARVAPWGCATRCSATTVGAPRQPMGVWVGHSLKWGGQWLCREMPGRHGHRVLPAVGGTVLRTAAVPHPSAA